MPKPHILIFAGYGLNCEEETQYAFELAGGHAQIVHINDVIDGSVNLKKFQIIVFPGGFCYGDDTGSGNAYALKIKHRFWAAVADFVHRDKLVLGICNGFQIIANLGLVPALNGAYGKREVALIHNTAARYSDRWVDLKIENKTPWFSNISMLSLPIAHGEGKFYTDNDTLEHLLTEGLVAARYTNGPICTYQHLDPNPNGSLDDIAALTDETGRVLGVMPHPERAIFFTQRPDWSYQKEELSRSNQPIPTHGQGLAVFKNGIKYFR